MSAPMNIALRGAGRICCSGIHLKRSRFNLFSSSISSRMYPKFNKRLEQLRRLSTEARVVDLVSSASRMAHFDSHHLVKYLVQSVFTTEEAEGLTAALMQILNTHIDIQQKQLVTKAQQEISVQQIMSHIASVKKDMVILEKSEFSNLRNETEKLHIELEQLKQTMKSEMSNMNSKMTLDMNLERSRAKEDHAKNETMLAKLDNKINTEVANLKTIYEQYRNETIKYAAGAILSCLTITLGFYRLWS